MSPTQPCDLRCRPTARASPTRASSSSSSSTTRWRSRKSLGASDAGAEVSEGVGLSVSVRKGEIENVERNRDKSIGITRLRRPAARQREHAPTSRAPALEQTVRAAYDIARFTAEDPAAGLPDADDLAQRRRRRRATSTCSIRGRSTPTARSSSRAAARPRRSRSTAASPTPKAPACRRSSRTSTPATRRGFRRRLCQLAPFDLGRADRLAAGQAATTCSATPGTPRCATPTSWPRPRRSAAMPPSARCRACGSRKIKTCEVPVLFESPLAAGLLGAYVQATSGGALYRKSSFLRRQPRQARCCAEHLDIRRGPAPAARQGQRAVRRRRRARRSARDVVDGGVVQGYFLSSYSARKLGMRTTGHAGGSHNLTLTSRAAPQPGDDLDAMLRKLAPRPVRHRADGAGRQLRHRRLLARRRRLLGRERRASPIRCTRSRSPATCATCSRASSRSAPTPTRWAARRSARC